MTIPDGLPTNRPSLFVVPITSPPVSVDTKITCPASLQRKPSAPLVPIFRLLAHVPPLVPGATPPGAGTKPRCATCATLPSTPVQKPVLLVVVAPAPFICAARKSTPAGVTVGVPFRPTPLVVELVFQLLTFGSRYAAAPSRAIRWIGVALPAGPP